jgi:hypothetical protein
MLMRIKGAAVAGHGHHDQRHPEDRDAQPSGTVSGHGRVGDECPHDPRRCTVSDRHNRHAGRDGDPRRLHTLSDGPIPVARPETSGRPGGRAVGQERQLGAEDGQDQGADTQRGEFAGTEATDDRQIQEQVQRCRDQHDEGRECEIGDAAHPPIIADRPAGPGAAPARCAELPGRP